MRQIRFIVVHCTAGNQDQRTTDIKAYWANVLGWKSYGYHYLINKNGSVEQLTDISKPTNGVRGFNSSSIHVCYKGGQKGVDNRTHEQKASMLNLIKTLKKQFPEAVVCGHRDFSPDKNKDGIIDKRDWIKLCPCFDVKQFCKENNI
jgi:N-acetylmuramoyl-L-alanine amidase